MGKLHVHIEHGHDNSPGPWIALAVLIALAAGGGAAKTAAHDLTVAAEIAAWSAAGCVVLAVVAGTALAVRRVRRTRAERRAWHTTVTAAAPERYLSGVAEHLPAIDASRPRVDVSWLPDRDAEPRSRKGA